jgi:hypothetical protein
VGKVALKNIMWYLGRLSCYCPSVGVVAHG